MVMPGVGVTSICSVGSVREREERRMRGREEGRKGGKEEKMKRGREEGREEEEGKRTECSPIRISGAQVLPSASTHCPSSFDPF